MKASVREPIDREHVQLSLAQKGAEALESFRLTERGRRFRGEPEPDTERQLGGDQGAHGAQVRLDVRQHVGPGFASVYVRAVTEVGRPHLHSAAPETSPRTSGLRS